MSPHRPPFKLQELKIEVNDRCQLACIHCSSDAKPVPAHEMSLSDCLKIITDAAGLGVREVIFSGGEPLLWDGLKKAVAAAATAGMSCAVYTTGNAPEFPYQISDLAKAGLSRAAFSLFGATAERHELTTRRRGSHETTVRAIQEASRCGVATEVHFVPFRSTFRDLPNIATQARDLGVGRVSVLRLVPQGRAALLQEFALDRVQNLEMKHTIEHLRSQGFDIRTGSPYNFLLLNEQPECHSGIDRAIIGPDLHLYPCDAFKQIRAEEVVGSADRSSLRSVSLAECWTQSPYLASVRQYLGTPFEEPCASCGVRKKCLSGCLAQKFLAYGDLRKRPDPMCLMKDDGRRNDN